MAKKRKAQTSLIDNDNQLLSIKTLLDTVLLEAENLNPNVKDFIVKTRDTAWDQFIKEQESNMPGRDPIH